MSGFFGGSNSATAVTLKAVGATKTTQITSGNGSNDGNLVASSIDNVNPSSFGFVYSPIGLVGRSFLSGAECDFSITNQGVSFIQRDVGVNISVYSQAAYQTQLTVTGSSGTGIVNVQGTLISLQHIGNGGQNSGIQLDNSGITFFSNGVVSINTNFTASKFTSTDGGSNTASLVAQKLGSSSPANVSYSSGVSTSANSGASGSAPLQVAGYLDVLINNIAYKIPYYNP